MRLPARTWGALALAAGLLLVPGRGQAEAVPAPDWLATGLVGQVSRLFVVADGTLLATAADRPLVRSDDGGITFRSIPVPTRSSGSAGRVLTVDPASADALYATTDTGLHRSADGGATYALILPGTIEAVSVSPAARGLLYVASRGQLASPNRLSFLRSRDGGASFELLQEVTSENPLCNFDLDVLQADASDPLRVFRAARCLAGRDVVQPDFTVPLERSLDQGATWMIVARPRRGSSWRLVGGRGVAPDRYYLSDLKPFFGLPASLYRSDDGGASFTEVFQFPRVEGPVSSSGAGPQTHIGELAYDPVKPDRVFIGRQNRASGVLVSEDGGLTFAELGRQDIGEVLDLALGPDGVTLFAATTEGLFRLTLSVPAPAQVPRRVF